MLKALSGSALHAAHYCRGYDWIPSYEGVLPHLGRRIWPLRSRGNSDSGNLCAVMFLYRTSYHQSQDFSRKTEQKINRSVGTAEYSPFRKSAADRQGVSCMGNLTKSALFAIDNTAWVNIVLASSASVLAVVVCTGAQKQ